MVTLTVLVSASAVKMASTRHAPPAPAPPFVTTAVDRLPPPPPPPPAPHARTRTTFGVKAVGLFQLPFALKVCVFVGRVLP
jgi:hypothetical protein